MEIKLPPPLITTKPSQNILDTLSLRLNQQIEVKVIDSKITENAIALQIKDKTLQVQSNLPVTVKPEQKLTLQLVKLQPLLEFKLIEEAVDITAQKASQSPSSTLKANDIILKQVLPETVNTPASHSKTSSPLQAPGIAIKLDASTLSQLTSAQTLTIKVIATTAKELTGVLLPDPINAKAQAQQTIAIPRNQIVNLTPEKANQLLTLEIVKDTDPLQFKMVSNNTPAATNYVITEAVKRHLPLQTSPLPLLQQLAGELESQHQSVPETLKRLAHEILQSLPQRSQLSRPDTLKQLLDNSGRFLEAKLLQVTKQLELNLQDDFKLKLLKLITQLQQQLDPKTEQKTQQNDATLNLFKELLQKSNGVLARIILDQLNSLPREEGNKQVWTLELPFMNHKQAEQIRIEIEQDKQDSKRQRHDTWSVNITVTPPSLGTIHCKIISIDRVVSTRFWSENQSTVHKIDRNLAYLKQQLENNGIKPGIFEVQQGKPSQAAQMQFLGRSLLNEKV